MLLRFLIAVGILLSTGCGGPKEKRPALQPTTGSLRINGKPAVGARLFFYPIDDQNFDERGTRPSAKVDEAGNFATSTYQTGDGIPVGEYRVGIVWMNSETSSSPWDQLNGRYANPQESRITVSVTAETKSLAPIELNQVQLIPAPRKRPGPDRDGDG